MLNAVKTEKWVYLSLFVVSCLLLLSGWSMGFSDAKEYISVSLKKTSQVQQGQFVQQVTGYGELHSMNKRILTSSSDALVDQILLNPGDLVEPGSVIMLLKNPLLEEQVEESLSGLQNKKLAKRKQLLEQQQEILSFESRLLELTSEAEIAKLQVEAQLPLVEKGIVSVLDFKRSKVKAEQLVKREALEQSKLEKLTQVHTEQIQILDEEITQASAKFERSKQRLASLQVKSEIPGILQSMDVKLGQRVSTGAQLALVGSLSPLVAKVRIPQIQASTVKSGAKAEIDTRNGIVEGVVNRVDPVVKEGAVEAEIQLAGDLSKGVRPLQLVEATIFGESSGQRMYVKQPDNATENTLVNIFKMTGENIAQRVDVSFGASSGGMIEVVSGLSAGDNIVLSALEINEDTQIIQFVQ